MKSHDDPSVKPRPHCAAQGCAGLDTLALRQSAQVVGFLPPVDDRDEAILLRLMEIGFLPGEEAYVVAKGFPGGDPMAVRVGSATFALRRYEAALVQVMA